MDQFTFNMERIIIVVMIFVAVSANFEPDFSCDFNGGDYCNITNLEGRWSFGNGGLRPTWTNSSSGDMRTFSIPYRFMTPSGILSFTYTIMGSGNLEVTTCRDQTEPVLEVSSGGTNEPPSITYSCTSASDVEVQFTATRGSVAPVITVDDIIIYETNYTDVTTTPSSGTSEKVTSQTWQPSTQSITPNSPSKTPPSTSSPLVSVGASTGVTDKRDEGSPSWIIPVASVIAILLLAILVALILIFCYRRREQTSKRVEKMNSREEPPTSVVKEVRYSNQTQNLTSDVEYYSEIKNGQPSSKPVYALVTKNEKMASKQSAGNTGSDTSAAAAFKIDGDLNGVGSNLEENPLYGDQNARPNEQEHNGNKDLVDNPLYGDQNDRSNGLSGSSQTDDLVDNPLYGDQNERSNGQGPNEHSGSLNADELVDNPLYGDQHERPNRQGLNEHSGPLNADDLIDNPLYGGQNEKSNGQRLNGHPDSSQTDDLVDNPLYGDQSERSNGQGINDFGKSEDLIDNPLYGDQH